MIDKRITGIKQAPRYKSLITCMLIFFIWLPATSVAEEEPAGPYVENSLFSLRLIPRTPEQMMAFYEARGFPKSALELIKKTCFFTGVIQNKSTDTVWLELKYWRFYTENEEIKRFDRLYWNAQWDSINLPQRNRSTFGWTQLPEIRDLLPNESVGGNIVLPQIKGTFTLEALFNTGKNKRGSEIRADLRNIKCETDIKDQ